eukprot:COSAG02_NODE_2239_length_9411_cov_3.663552_4_plen_66_part_00
MQTHPVGPEACSIDDNGHKALCPLSRHVRPGIMLANGAGIHVWGPKPGVWHRTAIFLAETAIVFS